MTDKGAVAACIVEHRTLGIDSFVESGYPHLEQTHGVAKLVLLLIDQTRVECHAGVWAA